VRDEALVRPQHDQVLVSRDERGVKPARAAAPTGRSGRRMARPCGLSMIWSGGRCARNAQRPSACHRRCRGLDPAVLYRSATPRSRTTIASL